jgi:glycine amidinotransferase
LLDKVKVSVEEIETATAVRTHVECWSEWGRLRHVIVGVADGACIPPPEPAFMARIPKESDMRDRHGPRTNESVARANYQLDGFAQLLEKRGIRVDRPTPIDFNQTVRTPDFEHASMFGCMPPRDVLITVGREVLEATMSFRSRYFEYLCYRPLLQRYFDEDPDMRHEAAPRPRLTDRSYRHGYLGDDVDLTQRMSWVAENRFVTTEEEPVFDAADIVRCGRDLFVQHGFTTNLKGVDWLRRHFPDLRIHAMNFPGDPYPSHIDCTFLPLRPRLVLSNPQRPPLEDQVRIFHRNDWEIVPAAKPAHDRSPPLCYSSVWLSMNILSLDEETVCVEASEVHLMEQLDKLGFEVVPVPFRDAYAFGGGLHCATTDIWREGACEDLFPNKR